MKIEIIKSFLKWKVLSFLGLPRFKYGKHMTRYRFLMNEYKKK